MKKPTFITRMRDAIRRISKQLEGPKEPWLSPRGLLLFILPLPIVPALFVALAKGEFRGALIHVVVAAMYLLGAILARRGLQRVSRELNETSLRKPLPLRTMAAVLIAAATALTSWQTVGHSAIFSIMMFGLTLVAFYLSYGLDSLDWKVSRQQDDIDRDFVSNLLYEAEEKIEHIEAIAKAERQIELKTRMLRISQLAREIIREVENKPSQLSRARKFLYVYLDGTQRVTDSYAKTHQQLSDGELEEKFRRVLVTIEGVFSEQKRRLAEDELFDLDVQIDVLNKQLTQEGFR